MRQLYLAKWHFSTLCNWKAYWQSCKINFNEVTAFFHLPLQLSMVHFSYTDLMDNRAFANLCRETCANVLNHFQTAIWMMLRKVWSTSKMMRWKALEQVKENVPIWFYACCIFSVVLMRFNIMTLKMTFHFIWLKLKLKNLKFSLWCFGLNDFCECNRYH